MNKVPRGRGLLGRRLKLPDRPFGNILLWGGGSQARVVEAMISEAHLGSVSMIFDESLYELAFTTSARFSNNTAILRSALSDIKGFVPCIGNEHGFARYWTARGLEELGLTPVPVIHCSSFIDPTCRVGRGPQIMPHAVVHKFARLGDYVLVNTGANIEHESIVGDGAHIMSNAVVAGRVAVGAYATIGSNATILPGLRIGAGAIVGAGAVVDKDVAPHDVVAGVPAKVLRKHAPRFFSEGLRDLGAEAGNNVPFS